MTSRLTNEAPASCPACSVPEIEGGLISNEMYSQFFIYLQTCSFCIL